MFHLTSLSLHSHSALSHCNLKTLKSQANHNQTLLNSSFFLLSLSSHFYLCYSLNTKWHTTTISATAGLEVGSNGCSSHQVASRPIAGEERKLREISKKRTKRRKNNNEDSRIIERGKEGRRERREKTERIKK